MVLQIHWCSYTRAPPCVNYYTTSAPTPEYRLNKRRSHRDVHTSRATTDMAAPSGAGGVTVDGEVTLSSRAPHAVR